MKLTTMEKAIATIQEYCRKHQCGQCKYSAYGVTRCLFQSDAPCYWEEDFERMQNEAEETNGKGKNII